jgi:hypothetical protein
MLVIPIRGLPGRRSLAWSMARCHGMIGCRVAET